MTGHDKQEQQDQQDRAGSGLVPLGAVLAPSGVPTWERPKLAAVAQAVGAVRVSRDEAAAVAWLCQHGTRDTVDRLAAVIERARTSAGGQRGMRRSEVHEAVRDAQLESGGLRVTLHSPVAGDAVMSRQGQPLVPVVTAPGTLTDGISTAVVSMPPGHAARAHVHDSTDVVVVVTHGRAVTLWWDLDGTRHAVVQSAGEQVHIPRGVPHAAVNLAAVPVIALESRSNSVFDADNRLLPDLDGQVQEYLSSHLAVAR